MTPIHKGKMYTPEFIATDTGAIVRIKNRWGGCYEYTITTDDAFLHIEGEYRNEDDVAQIEPLSVTMTDKPNAVVVGIS